MIRTSLVPRAEPQEPDRGRIELAGPSAQLAELLCAVASMHGCEWGLRWEGQFAILELTGHRVAGVLDLLEELVGEECRRALGEALGGLSDNLCLAQQMLAARTRPVLDPSVG